MGIKTLVVVNPNSANGATRKQWPDIEKEISKHVSKYEYVFTSHMGHATDLTREGLKEGFDMIVAVGGDGTNNEVVNGFFENRKPINPDAMFAPITRGTGGDLRRTIGTSRDYVQSAAALEGSATRSIDVGHMTLKNHDGEMVERCFINIASFGIGGEVDARVNRTTKVFGGFASFAWASITSILTYQNKQIHLKIDGKEIGDFNIFNCAVANGQFFGGGMQIAPDAAIDDGLFDIVCIGDFSKMETLIHMGGIYKGKHVNHPKVQCFKGTQVEATSEETVLLDVDGEQPGSIPSVFTMMPKALKLKIKD